MVKFHSGIKSQDFAEGEFFLSTSKVPLGWLQCQPSWQLRAVFNLGSIGNNPEDVPFHGMPLLRQAMAPTGMQTAVGPAFKEIHTRGHGGWRESNTLHEHPQTMVPGWILSFSFGNNEEYLLLL